MKLGYFYFVLLLSAVYGIPVLAVTKPRQECGPFMGKKNDADQELRRVLQLYNQLPEQVVAEIINGKLIKHLGPLPFHDNVSENIYTTLLVPFQLGFSGPGGWHFRKDPLIDLKHKSPRVKPDIAGWRLDDIPESGLHNRTQNTITVRPDWVCEVMSKKTREIDLTDKKDAYATAQIPFYWIVDPRNLSLEIWALQPYGNWKVQRIKSPTEGPLRLEPFQPIEIDLNTFWEIPHGYKRPTSSE